MIFAATDVQGCCVIDLERHEDMRGFFARTWCAEEFAAQGLNSRLTQCSISFNKHTGTLRGIHYQVAPFQEAKVIRCTRGSIYDVCVDLRPASPTFTQHVGVTLSAINRRMLYIPEGCARGFLTLEDDTEVFYQMSQSYSAEHARGVRWNDPAFGIVWPLADPIMLERDRTYPDFTPDARA